jgi:hypothetical protein
METSVWLCCFCGKEIEMRGPNPCKLIFHTSDDKSEYWKCHAECFRAYIVEEIVVAEKEET